jgi:hypothetical protein
MPNPSANVSRPHFQSRFARATHPNASPGAGHFFCGDRQARHHVFELSQLNLNLCFLRSRTACKNLEYEFRSVDDFDAQGKVEIGHLSWCEVVVEDGQVSLLVATEGA